MGLFWLVAAYVVGHIVAHIASAFLEETVLRRGLGSPEEHLLGAKKSGWTARIFPGNFKPFPAATRQRVLAKAQQHNVTASDRSFFFHCHPLVKRDQATLERLNSFLNLYGFSRNLSMALLLTVPLLLYIAWWGSECGFRRGPLRQPCWPMSAPWDCRRCVTLSLPRDRARPASKRSRCRPCQSQARRSS